MLNRRLIPTRLNPERSLAIKAITRRSPLRLIGAMSLLWWLALRWLMTKISPRRLPWIALRIRALIERHGGAWIKAAQLVAIRRDLFPADLCDVLAALQDRASGFPGEAAVEILETELGATSSEIFESFERDPIAAGSVGQVHRAVLRGGVAAAVKIQRPGIEASFEADLNWIRRFITWFARLNIKPEARWGDFLWELEHMLSNELDYRIEAAAQRRMRAQIATHRVYVPRVFDEWSSRRVLVMELIEGVFMSEYIETSHREPARLEQWLNENNIDPQQVGQYLYDTHTRQVFEDNFFHSDLHPGNIALLRNSRIALIDFGSVGSIDNTKLKKYYLMFQAISDAKFEKAAELLMLLGPGIPMADPEPVRSALVKELRLWQERSPIADLPYHERSMTTVISRMAMILQRNKIPATWEFMRVNRAEVTMDAALAYLMPDIDYFAMIHEYERAARGRELQRRVRCEDLPRQLARGFQLFDSLDELSERIYFDSEWVRRRATTFVADASKAALAAAGLMRVGIHAVTLLTLFVPALYLFQRGTLRGAASSVGLEAALDRLPALSLTAVVFWVVVLLYLRFGFGRLHRTLRAPEIRNPP